MGILERIPICTGIGYEFWTNCRLEPNDFEPSTCLFKSKLHHILPLFDDMYIESGIFNILQTFKIPEQTIRCVISKSFR